MIHVRNLVTALRRVAAVAALGVALAFGAPDRGAAQEEGVREVIASQLEAFLRDDFAAAFEFASPGIRAMFGTPENFGRMVRQGYPMVWRPGSYSFSTLEPRQGRPGLRQSVVITDASGKVFVADYHMIEVDGAWRIDGVSLRERIAAGA